jgi:hypothetical protein
MVRPGSIRIVVLNACYSDVQARAIASVIDCVIGMSDAIGDEDAIAFSAAFYRALGFGRSVQTAFDLGKVAMELEDSLDAKVPELHVREGVKADDVKLV